MTRVQGFCGDGVLKAFSHVTLLRRRPGCYYIVTTGRAIWVV